MMPVNYDQLILFPDIEDVLVDYLTGKLGAATVHTKVPSPRPESFVKLARVGGPRTSLVTDRALMSFECWGSTPKGASDLAQLTRTYVNGLKGRVTSGHTFYGVEEFSGPQNLPDGVSDQSRYVFTTAVSVRGVAL